ncbi:MAG: hypothetical protein ACRC8Y_09520, partial [Chroococcales cyanobacterium]
LFAMPVTAQITEAKVDSLVEALRLAAPDTGREDDGLYSDWQSELPNGESEITPSASYPADCETVDFLRPLLSRLTPGR